MEQAVPLCFCHVLFHFPDTAAGGLIHCRTVGAFERALAPGERKNQLLSPATSGYCYYSIHLTWFWSSAYRAPRNSSHLAVFLLFISWWFFSLLLWPRSSQLASTGSAAKFSTCHHHEHYTAIVRLRLWLLSGRSESCLLAVGWSLPSRTILELRLLKNLWFPLQLSSAAFNSPHAVPDVSRQIPRSLSILRVRWICFTNILEEFTLYWFNFCCSIGFDRLLIVLNCRDDAQSLRSKTRNPTISETILFKTWGFIALKGQKVGDGSVPWDLSNWLHSPIRGMHIFPLQLIRPEFLVFWHQAVLFYVFSHTAQ